MLDSPRRIKGFVAIAMYYLPLPWVLYETVALIPFPSAEGWSLLYYHGPHRDYWIVYAELLALFGILPWTMGNPLERGVFKGWRDFFVHLFWGYAIALAAHLGWVLILAVCGFLGPRPLDGEDLTLAILILWYLPPFWAPVIGAVLVIRRGSKHA
jgi:hypothetical protein